jgi:hypothetical protein
MNPTKDLTTIINNINSNYSNVKDWTNETPRETVDRSKSFIEQTKQENQLRQQAIRYHQQKKLLDKTIAATELRINNWIAGKASVKGPSLNEISSQECTSIVKKAKWTKIGLKVAMVATCIFAAIPLLAVCIGFALADGGTSFSLALLLTSAGGGSALAGILSLFTCLMNRAEVLRQKRTLTSTNFKHFVQIFLRDKNFNPSSLDLIDLELHNIYLEWKTKIKKNNS